MLPGFDVTNFAHQYGPLAAVLVIMAIIFAESGLLIGFFLPGDSILFTAGFLVQTGVLRFDIHLIVILVFIAAVAGDGVGYLFGKKVGRKIFTRPNSLLFRHENIQKAEDYYEQHGNNTIILARFIPVIRTFVPIVAGVGSMKYRSFILFNVIGAFLWAVGITYAGYYIGAGLEHIGINVDTILLPIVTLIVIASILPPTIHILKDEKRRKTIVKTIKQRLRR
jgi:membrane-associated protein